MIEMLFFELSSIDYFLNMNIKMPNTNFTRKYYIFYPGGVFGSINDEN